MADPLTVRRVSTDCPAWVMREASEWRIVLTWWKSPPIFGACHRRWQAGPEGDRGAWAARGWPDPLGRLIEVSGLCRASARFGAKQAESALPGNDHRSRRSVGVFRLADGWRGLDVDAARRVKLARAPMPPRAEGVARSR